MSKKDTEEQREPKKSSGKKVLIGIIIFLILIFLVVIVILPGIALLSISSARESAYDTQIRSELSQVRLSIERYYFNHDQIYLGFEESDYWVDLKTNIPSCSANILNDDDYLSSNEDYQISVSEETYVVWAPLCAKTDQEESFVSACADYENKTQNYYGSPVQLDGEDCFEVFGN